jgi:hypothetical protein
MEATEQKIREAMEDFKNGIKSVLSLRNEIRSGAVDTDDLAAALGNIVEEQLVLPMWLEPFDGIAITTAFKAAFAKMKTIKEMEATQ